MRTFLCVILLFFSIAMNTKANGVNDFNYSFYLIPIADPEKVIFEIVIKNEGDLPLHFEFPTSQMIEITITDQAGAEVYVYSKGKYFLQAFQSIVVEPHQSVKRYEKWNYQFKGKRIPSGVYTVNALLKPISLNDEPIKNRAKLYHSHKLKVPEENPAFRFVKVSGSKGDYIVTGEVRPANRGFFYSVENGHKEYIKEKEVVLKGKEEWEPFKLHIQLPTEKVPANGSLMLNLYERDDDRNIISLYPIILEITQ